MSPLFILVLVVLIVILLLAAGSYALFHLAFVRWKKPPRSFCKQNDELETLLAPYQELMEQGQWYFSQPLEEVSIRAHDGITLRGTLLSHPNPRGVLLGCHGYRSSGPHDFSGACRFYYQQGFSLLVISQRASATSDGTYICMGAKEQIDCQNWAEYLDRRYNGALPIVMAGVSMGATTVLLAAGRPLPSSVRAIIADCPFCSPWERLDYILKTSFKLPVHPTLDAVNLWCRLLAGFDLKRVSVLAALEKNTLPIQFFHGSDDDYVPYSCSEQAYRACRAPADLCIIPDAGHGMAFLVDPDRYKRVIISHFLRAGL